MTGPPGEGTVGPGVAGPATAPPWPPQQPPAVPAGGPTQPGSAQAPEPLPGWQPAGAPPPTWNAPPQAPPGWQPAAGPPPGWSGAPPPDASGPAVPKRRRGCFATGCLASLVVLLVAGLVAGGLWLRVPQKLGLWPTGETLWSGEPDRAAATAILADLKSGGIDTTGLTLYVMPVANSGDVVAYAVLDLSKGFHFPAGGDRPGIMDLLVKVASTGAASEAGVGHVGLEYRDRTGATVGVLTATPDDIAAYARGDLTDEQFQAAVGGWIDPAFLLQGVSQ